MNTSNVRSSRVTLPSEESHSGPLLYFAVSMIAASCVAFPMIIPRSIAVKDDPNPLGYLLLLVSVPMGGLVYRLRSRNWPIDGTVRSRQIIACCATFLLPLCVVAGNGLSDKGLAMTYVSGIVSLMLISGILISGRRRWRPN